jgi:tRNA G18 (ribose-2'-O)-methylase SpoU
MAEDDAGAAAAAAPRHYLILNNVQKIKNIKNMLVSASAFGVKEVLVVGQKKFDLQEQKQFLGALSCRVTRLATLKDCRAHCVERGIRVVGVEIMHDAKSIADHPFQGDTAFIMGNEVRLTQWRAI